ncbi:MAG: AmmeMemoRadiSam system protein B [Candidatus Marinimicrobia bacterium]|nr:AmmeMemoRadiSam system protein B [Candidatus Neomarinimicrobiota bacterium]
MQLRKPAVAGQFYPGDRSTLTNMLDELFTSVQNNKIEIDGHIAGLIAPHAGYIFSGKQAAKAYYHLKDRSYKRVCIISPSHREYFPAISVYPGAGYQTPLGTCPVDEHARSLALECNGIISSMQGHRAEHALEVQLPFIQYFLGNIPILPMVMGDQGKESIEEAGECVRKLYDAYGKDILFVASSDLSHFHDSRTAENMDGELISLLEKADIEQIYKKLRSNDLEACGGGPIIAILKGLDINKEQIRVLGYSHSGEVMNDRDSVVGYTSALIFKNPKEH